MKGRSGKFGVLCIVTNLLVIGCQQQNENNSKTLFSKIDLQHSNIAFKNELQETERFNYLTYDYFYNGSGVAIGDINNDGLPDIYFGSNQHANALYLNKGGFTFEEITGTAGVSDDNGWTTGVNMVDINQDGWLDIYVCKSGL